MDVKSVANATNVIRSYNNVDGNQSQYLDTNIVNNSISVNQAKESQKNTNDNNENLKDKAYEKKDLDKAVNKLNKFLEDENTHAEYSYHKDLGTLMIKIVDKDTDKIILELPPEKILNMVASMCKQVGLLDKKAWFTIHYELL